MASVKAEMALGTREWLDVVRAGGTEVMIVPCRPSCTKDSPGWDERYPAGVIDLNPVKEFWQVGICVRPGVLYC